MLSGALAEMQGGRQRVGGSGRDTVAVTYSILVAERLLII